MAEPLFGVLGFSLIGLGVSLLTAWHMIASLERRVEKLEELTDGKTIDQER